MLREERGESVISNNFRPYTQETWDKYSKEKKTFAIYMGLYEGMRGQEEEFKAVVRDYEEDIRAKDMELAEAKKTIERLQSSLTLVVTPEDSTKEIIKMYSKGNGALVIHKNLTEFKKMNIEYETITDIIFKLENEDLPIHLMEYYNDCIKTLLTNPVTEEEKIKIEELRRLKSHQEQSDAILNDIKKRLASCSVDEVKELTDLMMKVMENQRRTSESMSKWNRGNGNINGNNQVSEVVQKDTDKFEKQAVQAFLNFDGAVVEVKEVV